MLVLTRKADEQILIGNDIKITLVRVKGNSVRIGIDAPRDVRIVRGELEAFDSNSDKQGAAEFELNDREQVFAHPQAKVISGRVKIADEVPAKSAAVTLDPVKRSVTENSIRNRAPLAGFVSAT